MNGGLLRSERENKGAQVAGARAARGQRCQDWHLVKPGSRVPKDHSGSWGSGRILVGFEMTTVQA